MANGSTRDVSRVASRRSHLRIVVVALVQSPAVPAHAGHRKPDEVLVASGETDMQPVTAQDCEELSAAGATPFLFHGVSPSVLAVSRYGERIVGESVSRADAACTQRVLAKKVWRLEARSGRRREDQGETKVGVGLELVLRVAFDSHGLEEPPLRGLGRVLDVDGLTGTLEDLLPGL